jgi:superfamily II DNA or RNA helicase
MTKIKKEITRGTLTAFVDSTETSLKQHQPNLLLNNKKLGKKVLSSILGELQTCDEFWFSVAFVTKSGLMTILNALEKADANNVKGKILLSQYLNFTEPQALRMLLKFKNIETRIVTDRPFHSKGYLFKKQEYQRVIIGSSNLTGNALTRNTELNISFSAANGSQILNDIIEEFTDEFKSSKLVNESFINSYQKTYDQTSKLRKDIKSVNTEQQKAVYNPNRMQVKALSNLKLIREQGADKALLISATGTGKTFLAAFDVQKFGAKKMLFVVHRKTIALKAMETFERLFGKTRSYGIFSGSKKDISSNFIFATVQTICKPENYQKFSPEHFDYIIMDETHRAGASSYNPIFEYFSPLFLLGMTATPERTDGQDIFKKFDHNIAHEIRLHDAMSENMLTPFHYFGISDLEVDGENIDDLKSFNKLTSDVRIDHIIKYIKFYGTDIEITRGLIFCLSIEECNFLSNAFNMRGFRTIALSGTNSEDERSEAIRQLESDNLDLKLDYIFTVDIFNEGIDIPTLNQIVMLRPTQSAIIFVQQLGRGLRKCDGKSYLTVIDFIGNYQSNYLVPVALYGDTSYSKDTLRKLMASGSSLIPGSSTINFDKITTDRIYQSIDQANLQTMKELKKDYFALKYKLGFMPKMVDFLNHGYRDPQLYIKKSRSFYNFVLGQESDLPKISVEEKLLLELFSNEINNAKRVVETELLNQLIQSKKITLEDITANLKTKYDIIFSKQTILSAVDNLNFSFVTTKKNNKLLSYQEIHKFNNVSIDASGLQLGNTLKAAIKNPVFKLFLMDNIKYALQVYKQSFDQKIFMDGFLLYQKYSRKDVFRILNWSVNPVAQNVGGYIISKDLTNCPIFVNYHKSDDISETTKYEDRFINSSLLQWMSKSRRTLNSSDVKAILNAKGNLRLPLFIKKSNDEGIEFYYMGELSPVLNSVEETTMKSDKDSKVSVVKVNFEVTPAVEETIFNYITSR